MFPVGDDNPEPGLPLVTWGLIGLCVSVFLVQIGQPPGAVQAQAIVYGMVPAEFFGAAPDVGLPAWMTLFTSQFLHGGLGHLAGNMLYLWIFGDNVELAMGRLRFLAFYLVCGAVAALAQGFLAPASTIPLIGASGAISGVLGAYLMLYPHGRVRVFMFPIGFFIVPAIAVLGLWFAMQLLSGLSSDPTEPGVAFWAHVGGFIAGMLLIVPFRRRGVRLWQGARRYAPHRGPKAGPWGRRK